MKYIVLITDCVDVAYNELRAAILSEIKNQNDIKIEPVAPVAPFSIINGNFILRLMGEVYPEGTIFSVVLNPFRKRPLRLAGITKKKKFIFIGANTGVFTWFLRDFGCKESYELHDPGFFPFGGKFVHAPIVAKIANGQSLAELGKPFNKENFLNLNIAEGIIVHIDNFGVMKFYSKLPINLKEGNILILKVNKKSIKAIYAKRMMSREDGEWVVYPGSSLNLPELGRVRRNGAQEINVKIGDKIIIDKIL